MSTCSQNQENQLWPLNRKLAAKLALALFLQHSNTTSPQESCKRSSQAMPTYANLCPDTPIASIDISDIDIRYTRYVWRDWQFPHLWQCLHPDQCFNSTHYSTKTKLKSKLRVLFGTYRRSQCLFLQVYIDQVSFQNFTLRQHLWSAFTKFCSCWTKKDPLLMRHPPLGFFFSFALLGASLCLPLKPFEPSRLEVQWSLASKSKTCSEACSCPAPATLQHNISPGVLQKK